MCEYCKEDMESKSISNKYAIETIVDGEFLYNYCECGLHTVVKINYCPMCGRKLTLKCRPSVYKWLCFVRGRRDK